MSSTSALPALCVPVVASTQALLRARSEALRSESLFQELRLDHLHSPLTSLQELVPWIEAQQGVTFLATCRRLRSGGSFAGTVQDELAILQTAAAAGCSLVDLSVESAEELGVFDTAGAIAALRSAGARVMLSFHDFFGTPNLPDLITRLQAFPADLFKIVPTAKSLNDSLDLLKLLRSNPGPTPLVAISMGEPGLVTRILGPQLGGAFTFAAGSPGEATAPGQLTAETLKLLYRTGSLSATSPIFAVAGDPIASSLSPPMHNAAFAAAGFNAVYVPLKTGNAAELFRATEELPLQGLSLTMPLKLSFLHFLQHIDPLASRIGAVNTVLRRPDGTLEGQNTDVDGIVEPLARRIHLQNARVLVLGAGGAARAAVFGCRARGAEVFIANRTLQTAEALAQESGAQAVDRSDLSSTDFDILINATPAGMRGNDWTCPVSEDELRARIVFDLVYNPLDTPLLAMARRLGLTAIPGVEMFVHQGARQFELWTGQPAPVQLMRATVMKALQQPDQIG